MFLLFCDFVFRAQKLRVRLNTVTHSLIRCSSIFIFVDQVCNVIDLLHNMKACRHDQCSILDYDKGHMTEKQLVKRTNES